MMNDPVKPQKRLAKRQHQKARLSREAAKHKDGPLPRKESQETWAWVTDAWIRGLALDRGCECRGGAPSGQAPTLPLSP